jgi:hypothetical protein
MVQHAARVVDHVLGDERVREHEIDVARVDAGTRNRIACRSFLEIMRGDIRRHDVALDRALKRIASKLLHRLDHARNARCLRRHLRECCERTLARFHPVRDDVARPPMVRALFGRQV